MNRISVAVAVILLSALTATAQISKDAWSYASNATAAGTTLSWTHTLGAGSNRLVVCAVAVGDPSKAVDPSTSKVTFGGTAMTAISGSLAPVSTQSAKLYSELFYLPMGTGSSSSSEAVAVTLAAAPTGGLVGGCASYFGVAQTGQPNTSAEGYDGSTFTSTKVTPTVDGDLIFDFTAGGSSSTEYLAPSSEETSINGCVSPTLCAMTENSDSSNLTAAAGYLVDSDTSAFTSDWSGRVGRSVESTAAFAPASGGASLITPTVAVTPASSSITTSQSLSVTVAVSGSDGTPAGTVTLSGSGYTSSATTLSSGSATITIPAGDLATGTDTLTASYTPSSASSGTYTSASGTATVTVTTASLATPTVTVTPASSSITTADSLSVTVAVSGSDGTPAGTVTLSGGGYTSSATTLSSGSATITIPAGDLATGTDTLTASYTPSSGSSSTYNSASGSAAVTVTEESSGGGGSGPTLATGDSRTVNQPSYPAVCDTLDAQFTTSQRSSPPSSDDTARLQAALTACAGTGESVVLASSGSDNAFFTGFLTISGEGLVINSGVSLYGNNTYYKSEDPQGKSELLYVTGNNSSIMGPGTVDGRGDIASGSARLVEAYDTTNFTVYNVTLAQAEHPNLYVEVGSGFTAYDLTISTPANRGNADGIDIDSISNVTVTNSTINAGDDGIAVKTNSGPASNITVKNSKFYGTHGLSIGSQTMYGVTNVLFENNYVYGVDLNGISSTDANAINIKTDEDCGGTVSKVTYLNTCVTEAKHLIVLDTEYGSCEGTAGTPVLTDIVVNGVLATDSVDNGYTRIRGYSSSDLINAYLANVDLDLTRQNDDQYATVYLDNSNSVPTGTGVTTPSFTLSGSVPSCSF